MSRSQADENERSKPDTEQTTAEPLKFDFDAYPPDTFFYERREGVDRRSRKPPTASGSEGERRAKKERRRRVDPTTFEKQYSDDELEFMNAMQHFKVQSGRSFPNYSEVLMIAQRLGYRKVVRDEPMIGNVPDDSLSPNINPNIL